MNTSNNKQSFPAASLSKLIKPALNFAGIVGTVGGFVADVLSPIGPIITYLIYISIGVLIISTAILFLLPANKRNSLKSVSVTSLFFAIIFVLFGQLNEDTENGFLGDNIEFIAEFQSTLNIIDEKLDKISDQVAVVDEKIDNIDNKLDQGFNDLASDVKEISEINNEKLDQISYKQEEVLTSIESLNSISEDLRKVLGAERVSFNPTLKSKIEAQLKSKDYKNLYNILNRRFLDFDFWTNTKDQFQEYSVKIIEKVPNTDIGYFRRAANSFINNDFDSAIKLLDSALAVNPKAYFCYNLRGTLQANNSKIEDLNRAYSLRPDSFAINYTRGLYYFDNKDYDKAITDIYKALELTNFKAIEIASNLLASYWNTQKWSSISDLLKKVNYNDIRKHITKELGEEEFLGTYNILPILEFKNSSDISFIESDIISEEGNIYVGYFLNNPNQYIPYATNKNGKFTKINQKDVFGFSLAGVKKPILDNSYIDVESGIFYIDRKNNKEMISKLRNSKVNEIFTVIFKVMEDRGSQNLDGEVLFIKKGAQNIKELKEFPRFKKLQIQKNGQITNW